MVCLLFLFRHCVLSKVSPFLLSTGDFCIDRLWAGSRVHLAYYAPILLAHTKSSQNPRNIICKLYSQLLGIGTPMCWLMSKLYLISLHIALYLYLHSIFLQLSPSPSISMNVSLAISAIFNYLWLIGASIPSNLGGIIIHAYGYVMSNRDLHFLVDCKVQPPPLFSISVYTNINSLPIALSTHCR